jgi:hypothetical protein
MVRACRAIVGNRVQRSEVMFITVLGSFRRLDIQGNTTLIDSFCSGGKTSRVLLFVALLVCLTICNVADAFICEVSTEGSPFNVATWASPLDLQSALSSGACTEIWLKAGTYTPTTGTDRNVYFPILRNLQLYGGFAGTEANRNQRDPTVNVTILSGDIGVVGDASDNSNAVLYLDGTGPGGIIDESTVIDGLTITGSTDAFHSGPGPEPTTNTGGLVCDGRGPGHECSPTINNVTISNNSDYGMALNVSGGGVSYSNLSNVTFSGNGNGIQNYINDGTQSLGSFAAPVLTNVTFDANETAIQGVAYAGSNAIGINLTNVTFSDNLSVITVDPPETPYHFGIMNNVIAWGNGDNSVFYNGVVSNSVIQGGCSVMSATSNCNVITTDPLLGPFQNNGGPTLTFLPGAGSSAIDTGNDNGCPATDQRGITRPQGKHCDIGAVEVVQITDRIFADGFEVTPTP